MSLQQRYGLVEHKVAQACDACGRDRKDVCIIAVSKTVDLDAVEEAIAAGVHDFGENRPAELVRKFEAFPRERWHFIGNIQSRQLPSVVGRACLIHSLYERKHAEKIDSLAAKAGIIQDVLIEVNDGEENKQGLEPDALFEMLAFCHGLKHVRVRGLMTMALRGDLRSARATFADLAILRDTMNSKLAASGMTDMVLRELSMGMSDDYLEAIPEGATMVRVGRAIFSDDYAG
ncbi:YggS family pyridoxal phosphate-dependent enzyme [Slackia sp.]|uniref:YggS family pyridoxal phosphate-dependent enzyme n=1 Tax=Slackia sp. TaxID=2049041 RepID=UPI002615EC9F|nr:YggS family pyridoxal phosphate-dependent enzyme [Slackia sp.]MEE0519052.1 YggS family pyridoxal phosphate-dependent enzyme [Slackia sp.]